MTCEEVFKETEIGPIPEEWELTNLNELVCHVVDNRGKTAPTSDSGIPLIATNCVKDKGLFPTKEKIRFVSEETYNSWFRDHPLPNDIIIVNKGSPGDVCLVPNPVDFCIAQDMIALRADPDKIYYRFLLAFLRCKKFKHQVDSLNVGTTIPHLKKTLFNKLIVPIPKDGQKIIGDIYYNLSKKIELLNETNETLEQIAQALFKHWFIDFEFPDENGNPYRSSGGAMKPSPMGMIPEDWEVKVIGDICQALGGGTPSTKKPEYWANGIIPWATPTDMTSLKSPIIHETERKITQEGLDNSSAKLLPINTIFMTSRATIGYFAIAKRSMCTNQGFISIICNEDISNYFLLNSLMYKRKEIENLASGSTFKEINKTNFRSIDIIVPSFNIMKKYHEMAEGLYNKIYFNDLHIQSLTELRDLLLPRLMSGKIRVPVKEGDEPCQA